MAIEAAAPSVNPLTGQPYSQTLAPELERLLAAQRLGGPKIDRYALPFPQSRQALVDERRRTRGTPLAMHEVHDEVLVVGNRTVGLRWFLANEECRSRTPLIYLHGGGWCVGSNETHDTVLRHLASATRMPVCGVDYALAPEHPFPAALDDVRAVTDMVLARNASSGLPRQVAMAGDSAGATLAIGEALRRRDAGLGGDIAALVLFYGVFTTPRASGSFAAYGDGRFGLSLHAHARYLDAYLPPSVRDDPRAFPLHAKLTGMPPTYLLAAELDPLFDESVEMHRAMAAASSPAELAIAPGMPHGFLNQANGLPQAAQALRDSAAFIQRMLG